MPATLTTPIVLGPRTATGVMLRKTCVFTETDLVEFEALYTDAAGPIQMVNPPPASMTHAAYKTALVAALGAAPNLRVAMQNVCLTQMGVTASSVT